MNTIDSWLAERRTGIGASDAATIGLARLSKGEPGAVARLVAVKRGLLPDGGEETLLMRLGKNLEPTIKELLCEQTGLRLRGLDGRTIVRAPEIPWVLASPDDLTLDGALVECKYSSAIAEDWGPLGTEQIPMRAYLQVQWGMMATGAETAWIAALLGGGREFRVYDINADENVQQELFLDCEKVWVCVQDGTDPPDLTAASPDVLAALLRDRIAREEIDGEALPVEQRDELLSYVSELRQAEENMDDAKMVMRGARDALCAFLALSGKDTLRFAGLSPIRWREAGPAARYKAALDYLVDGERVTQHDADLAVSATRGAPSRRFTWR